MSRRPHDRRPHDNAQHSSSSEKACKDVSHSLLDSVIKETETVKNYALIQTNLLVVFQSKDSSLSQPMPGSL